MGKSILIASPWIRDKSSRASCTGQETINWTIAPILIVEADAPVFDHGGTDNKPMPVSNASRISHNAAAPNTPASTAGDSTRHLKRWERGLLSY